MAGESHTFSFVVDAAHHGLRIDTFLAARLRNHPPARLQRLAEAGLVAVNDQPCPADRRIRRGEEVVVRLAEPPDPFYPPGPFELEILYDDPWILAINKPAGMIAHPVGPVGEGTLANALQAHLDETTRLPGLMRPGIVHRLDRETSGVFLVAKDHLAHAELTRQFERSAVSKTYLAWVSGTLPCDHGRIELGIGQRPGSLLMYAASDAVATRPATTEYLVLQRLRSTTLLEVRPRTGRKHQIRVHLAAIGHPVVGDAVYGLTEASAASRDSSGTCAPGRHALHAATIEFRHPVTNAPLRIAAPVSADFWKTIAPPEHSHS